MRQLDEEAFFAAAKPHMVAAGYMTGDECGEKLEWLKRVVATAKEHVAFAAQIPECVAMYFSDEFEFENAEAAAVLQEESVPTVMNMLFEELPKLEVLDGPAVKAAFKAIQKATKLGGKAVFMPIRVALTGNQHGPELAEMVPLLGLERTEARIRASLAKARFNYIYGETLVEPEILLPDNAACLRLPGTDGKAKMSKSLGNCIYLSDSADEVQKKVKSMYTDPDHLRVQDPGKLEGNTVFTYLDAFCRPEHFGLYLPEYPNLDELKAHYQRGGLGDMKVKKFLNEIMQETLEPIRNRRKEFEKDIPAIYDMLKKGCETARETAAATLDDVRKAMKINYFDDAELIAEQVKKFGGE